ncbi:MAG: hypothetical protein E6I31_01035 [Chloroflexi bacterium]|nr:MAG: hypothetical protein E6I31_01035 [Chloroflexota bacterium]
MAVEARPGPRPPRRLAGWQRNRRRRHFQSVQQAVRHHLRAGRVLAQAAHQQRHRRNRDITARLSGQLDGDTHATSGTHANADGDDREAGADGRRRRYPATACRPGVPPPGHRRLDEAPPTRAPSVVRSTVALVLALTGAVLWHPPAHGATHRAALVIQHSASWPGPRALWKCVEFAQEAIGGLALLELAGVNSGQPPQVYDWGGGSDTVCQLDRQPTPVPDRCFGPTSGPNWSDWHATPSGWVARSTGVNGYTLHDGDIEGWTYTSTFGAPPPAVRFAQVCAAAAPTVVATHSATAPAAVRAAPTATATTAVSAPISPNLQAAAPSVSITSRSALAVTGPPTQRPTPPSIGPWLLFGGAAALLVGLGAVNLRRNPAMRHWKIGLALAVVPILFSAALSRFGRHVIFTLPGIPIVGGAWSWEAVAYGASTGVALLLTVAVFATLQASVRSADLVALLPRPLYRAGTVFALSLAFAPKTVASFQALREARRLRGQRAGWRSAPGLVVPLLLTMLEQALQYGESLDARGYGSRRRSRYRPLGWSLMDGLVIGTSVAALVLNLALSPQPYNPYLDLAPSLPSAFSLLGVLLLGAPALTAVPRMDHAADRA